MFMIFTWTDPQDCVDYYHHWFIDVYQIVYRNYYHITQGYLERLVHLDYRFTLVQLTIQFMNFASYIMQLINMHNLSNQGAQQQEAHGPPKLGMWNLGFAISCYDIRRCLTSKFLWLTRPWGWLTWPYLTLSMTYLTLWGNLPDLEGDLPDPVR